MIFSDLPAGAPVFLDANTLLYHFTAARRIHDLVSLASCPGRRFPQAAPAVYCNSRRHLLQEP
ncbi:MAG TPA: hypothetical protein VG013_36725 [Gemmataceae bacterium]|jgi:hypothetical protein|nr:hypothetical protein [Gemmataceae bacterium]